jgi:hypothetical protein
VFDPNLDRPYQLTYNVGLQHELLRGTSVSFEWFHSDFRNLIARNNVARSASDYTPVTVYSPIDGSPITYYNISAAKQSAVQNVDSNDPQMKRWYNGFEININARPPGRRQGLRRHVDRTHRHEQLQRGGSRPEPAAVLRRIQNNLPWITAGKLAGSYPLPWQGITLSGALQALAGQALGTAPIQYGVFTAGTGFAQPNGLGTFWLVTPSLNYAANCKGNCSPGRARVPGLTPSSAQIGLVAPGTEFTAAREPAGSRREQRPLRSTPIGSRRSSTSSTRRIRISTPRSPARSSARGIRSAVGDSAGAHRSGRCRREVVTPVVDSQDR